MQKTILQVPLDKQLKQAAERVASSQGFSSLQEIIRVFLTQLASNKVAISLQDSFPLSLKNEKHYDKMTKDFQNNKNIHSAKNIKNLLQQLNAD